MKLVFFVLFQLLLLIDIQSQNLVRVYSDYENVQHKSEYDYNEQNQVIQKIFSTYYKEERINEIVSKSEWSYENNRLIEKKEYQFDPVSLEWQIKKVYSFFYNDDGCMDYQVEKLHLSPGEISERRITMINAFDCSNAWKHDQEHYFRIGFTLENRVIRTRTDTSEIETYEAFDKTNGVWFQKEEWMKERKYNQKGNILEDFRLVGFYGYAEKTVYEYDETGEILLSFQNFHKDKPDTEWRERGLTQYVYGDGLVRKVKNGSAREDTLEYYCDGLIKQRTTTWKDSVERIATYEYDQKVISQENCEQLENLSLEIYPNPVRDVINIKSDIFQKANSKVLIHDIDGRLLYEQAVESRVHSIQINLEQKSQWSKIFIVRLISDEGLQISKLAYLDN